MNIYTMPTAFLVFFNIMAVLIVLTLFKDVSWSKKEDKDTEKVGHIVLNGFIPIQGTRRAILWAPMLACLATNFTHIFTLAVLET